MKVALHIHGQVRTFLSDAENVRREVELGVIGEEVGFAEVWATEHHFDDYSILTDNIQLMSYIAGRTKHIKLGIGAAILPWHTPLRVAERVAMLDALSNGRVLLAFGRGLSRSEYAGMMVDMSESRERFDEASAVILKALETGVVENENGHFYPQISVPLRPGIESDLSRDRLLGVAMSQGSLEPAARIGAMLAFVQGPIEGMLPMIDVHREHYRRIHGVEAPRPHLTDVCVCHEDAEEAERLMRQHTAEQYIETIRHYEFAGEHFANTKGYEDYAAAAVQIREQGQEAAVDAFIESQTWGTPEQIIEKVRHRLEVVGDYKAGFGFSVGQMPYEAAEHSIRTFAKHVLPELNELQAPAMAS